jgi:hypothetical protein
MTAVARRNLLSALIPSLLAGACIRAPDVVMIDRQTAIEEQAGGGWQPLADELQARAMPPGPEPYTQAGLTEAGVPHDPLGELFAQVAEAESAVDRLLTERCVGEARSGLLVQTPTLCTTRRDAQAVAREIERANRSRRQVWLYLQGRRPEASLEDVRDAWRRQHLVRVLCGVLIEQEPGKWEPKKC